jgi:hypothetical protein
VESSCEHGNEPSGSIKCWEVLEIALDDLLYLVDFVGDCGAVPC